MTDPQNTADPTSQSRGVPVPPIVISGDPASAASALNAKTVAVPEQVVEALRGACAEVVDDPSTLAEEGRDWWPLAMIWATEGRIPSRASVLVRPASQQEVIDVLRICNEHRVPVTPSAGRSGVLGASVPVFGGVQLDMCQMNGIREIDRSSMVADVLPGTFGDVYEDELRSQGLTGGHWPQSMTLSTVGGWLACRGAGQFSTRYGKIEDMVVGLDVVLADGTVVRTGGFPRAAVGPDLNQLFVGSEGTLGVITGARLKIHELPGHQRKAAYSFDSFNSGLDWLRSVIQRGAKPAVLRLYDPVESLRHFPGADGRSVAIVLDEGEPAIVDAYMSVVDSAARDSSANIEDSSVVDTWLGERNEVSALEALISRGFIVDTMEVSGRWSDLPAIADATLEALRTAPGSLAAGVHCSHSYEAGACLYFTFAAESPPEDRESRHQALWTAATGAALGAGASLSHHHGVGLNRGRFVRDALGSGLDVLDSIKSALDPNGILNPGKLGLKSSFGTFSFDQ
ncbi:MAG: FAD-binding oxidoreductase [Microthrixaceae bacterium]|nr:FAD-binding oxidoreductase [Microthrixaceae bacterium]